MKMGVEFTLGALLATFVSSAFWVGVSLPAHAATPTPAKLDKEPGTWSVRFPNHARLVYDADTRTCYCEGSLQDAFDGVVASMKSMQDRYERIIYGDKQVDKWRAEFAKGYNWP